MKHTTLPLVAKALGEKYDIQVQISGDQAKSGRSHVVL